MPIGKRNNQKIWISKQSTDCILRIRSLTFFFSTSPISNKCKRHILPRTLFFFAKYSSEIETLSHAIKADRTFVIWTKRESTRRRKSRSTTRSYSDVKLRKAYQITEKVNNEDSQLKKRKMIWSFKISFRTTNRFWKRRQK